MTACPTRSFQSDSKGAKGPADRSSNTDSTAVFSQSARANASMYSAVEWKPAALDLVSTCAARASGIETVTTLILRM